MTTRGPTLAETIVLLALSRGMQPPFIPPITRGGLLAKQWIRRGPSGKFSITEDGRTKLSESEYYEPAMRKLMRPYPVWSRM